MKTDNCKKVIKLLGSYVDGELPPDQKNLVQEELARCEDCQQEYERLLLLRTLVWENAQEAVRQVEGRSIWETLETKLDQVDQERAAKTGLVIWITDWLERARLGLNSSLAPAAGIATASATILVAGMLMYMASSGEEVKKHGDASLALPSIQSDVGDIDQGTVAAVDKKEKSTRRPAAAEKSFRRNECYVDSTSVDKGIVIVDVDPEEDMPVIVWHFTDEPSSDPGEDGAI
jgi:anti-sigma factor RsiW